MRAEARLPDNQARPLWRAAPAAPEPARRERDAAVDRAAVLRAAWKRYRFAYGNEDGFFPDLFAAVLEREWAVRRFQREDGADQARREAEAAARRAREPRQFMGAPVAPALVPAAPITTSR